MANYLSDSLINLALSDATVTEYVGTRGYYLKAPGDVTYPYFVIYFLDDSGDGFFIGEDGGSPVVSWEIITQSAAQAEAIYEALRKKILNYTGTYEGIKINKVEHRGRRDHPDFIENGYYQITWDAKIFFVHP